MSRKKAVPYGPNTYLVTLSSKTLPENDEDYLTYVTCFVNSKEEAIEEAYYSMRDVFGIYGDDNSIENAKTRYTLDKVEQA